jgi:hypothetical protein
MKEKKRVQQDDINRLLERIYVRRKDRQFLVQRLYTQAV